MSRGVDYSKWDNMDYASSDEDGEMDTIDSQTRVTTLDGPSSVTFGGGTNTITAASGGGGCMFAPGTAAISNLQKQRKNTSQEDWSRNGSNIKNILYWCQDRYSVTLRQQVPEGVASKDIVVQLKGALLYRYRHNAVISTKPDAYPSFFIQVHGIPILSGDIPYPCYFEEDHVQGDFMDWTLETLHGQERTTKYITITFFKAVPMEGVTVWWNRPLQHLPEIDISNCQGRTGGSDFQQTYKEAEAQFKAKLQQQQQQPQQQIQNNFIN